MIKQLKLVNFMRHEDLVVTFTDGLQVIKGGNESGKSTTVRAIAYALFGSRALPAPLAEIVTWGKPESALRVELTVNVDGRDIVFGRSKSGAEVRCNDAILVTGQTEVSNYATSLVGADATTADLLMFANQGLLQGTLSSGPKATGGLLETLADFDLFERLLTAATEKLALGSAALYEERLKGLKEQVELIVLPSKPEDDAAFAERLKAIEVERDALVLEINTVLTPASEVASSLYRTEDAKYNNWLVLVNKRDQLLESIEHQKVRIEGVAERAAANDVSVEIEALKAKQTVVDQHAKVLAAWTTFSSYVEPDLVFSGTKGDLIERQKEYTAKRADLNTRVATLLGDIKAKEALLVTSTVCGLCGEDVSRFPQVAAKNAQLEADILVIQTLVTEAKNASNVASEVALEAEGLLRDNNTLASKFKSIETYLDVDERMVPNRLTWRGDAPSADVPENLTPKIKALEKQQADLVTAKAQLAMLVKMSTESQVEADTLLVEIKANHMDVDVVTALAIKSNAALTARVLAEDKVRNLEASTHDHAAAHAETKRLWDQAASSRARILHEVKTTEAAISSLGFNNALVKKIRNARPVVTSKLWNMVLASVSTLFSQVRGTKSVVTRDDRGFKVNGQSSDTLSGSTADALGMAIRVALVKTFIPNCPFIVLDEPSAGCDAARTEAMIGFLAAVGFDQVLLITHETISESFADNLIVL